MEKLGQLQLNIAKVLAAVAKNKTVITYGELCKKVNYPSPRKIGVELEKLDLFSYEKHKVFVSCLVVQKNIPNSNVQLPSEAFFVEYLRKIGQPDKDWLEFFTEQKRDTYEKLDWDAFLQEVEAEVNPKK